MFFSNSINQLKVFTKTVQDSTAVTTAVSLPMNRFDSNNDPLSDIINWFNYEKCTLDEYYPSITIANLIAMVQDEAYTQYHKDIGSALMTVFRSLGEDYPQHVNQVRHSLFGIIQKFRLSHVLLKSLEIVKGDHQIKNSS